MTTFQVLLPPLKITPRFFFGNFRVLGKLHLHQTLSEIPSKPGGQVRNLPLQGTNISQPWKGNSSFHLGMGYVSSQGRFYFLLECFFLASLLRLLLQLLLITSKNRLKKGSGIFFLFFRWPFLDKFPQFFGWLPKVMDEAFPKKVTYSWIDLHIIPLLHHETTHSPSATPWHFFWKNHLQVGTKTTDRDVHTFQGTSRFSRSLAIWILWDLRSFWENVEVQRVQISYKPRCWWAVCLVRLMGCFSWTSKGLSVTKYLEPLWFGWMVAWKTFKTVDWQWDIKILSNPLQNSMPITLGIDIFTECMG